MLALSKVAWERNEGAETRRMKRPYGRGRSAFLPGSGCLRSRRLFRSPGLRYRYPVGSPYLPGTEGGAKGRMGEVTVQVKTRPPPGSLARWIGRELEGRFEIRSYIGSGTAGAVFVGWDAVLEQPVAVKVLTLGGWRVEPNVQRRFEGEARMLARLRDPRIVRPLSFGRAPSGEPYFVTELLEGCSLEDEIRAVGPLEPPRSVRLLLDVCSALGEAHAVGIVHRDIKTSNIFIQRFRSGEEVARLLDFGVAKVIAGNDSPLTEPGVILGTPAFMAPEQVVGGAIDGRTDLYSLGIVAFMCLTGTLPFEGPAMTVAMSQVHQPPPRFQDRAPGSRIDSALESLVLRLLEKNPNRRPRSAAELRASLEQWLVGVMAQQVVSAMELAQPVSLADLDEEAEEEPTNLVLEEGDESRQERTAVEHPSFEPTRLEPTQLNPTRILRPQTRDEPTSWLERCFSTEAVRRRWRFLAAGFGGVLFAVALGTSAHWAREPGRLSSIPEVRFLETAPVPGVRAEARDSRWTGAGPVVATGAIEGGGRGPEVSPVVEGGSIRASSRQARASSRSPEAFGRPSPSASKKPLLRGDDKGLRTESIDLGAVAKEESIPLVRPRCQPSDDAAARREAIALLKNSAIDQGFEAESTAARCVHALELRAGLSGERWQDACQRCRRLVLGHPRP